MIFGQRPRPDRPAPWRTPGARICLQILAGLGAVMAVVPSVSLGAGVVTYAPDRLAVPSFVTVVGGSENSELSISNVNVDTIRVTDTQPLVPGGWPGPDSPPGCSAVDATTVECPKPKKLYIDGGGGDDHISVPIVFQSLIVHGGANADTIACLLCDEIYGDDGPDSITGGNGGRVDGGEGDDVLSWDPASEAYTDYYGGGGDDTIHDGPLSDGITPGSGNDVISGPSPGETNTITSEPTPDGDDVVFAHTGGRDIVSYDARTDPLNFTFQDGTGTGGGAGESDVLENIVVLALGAGSDSVDARDGVRQSIVCQSTTNPDQVSVDGLDTPAPSCAAVLDSQAPNLTWVSRPPPTTTSTSVDASWAADETRVTYTCRFDSELAQPCPFGFSRAGLNVGEHQLVVTGTDPAGNASSISTTVRVDAAVPVAPGPDIFKADPPPGAPGGDPLASQGTPLPAGNPLKLGVGSTARRTVRLRHARRAGRLVVIPVSVSSSSIVSVKLTRVAERNKSYGVVATRRTLQRGSIVVPVRIRHAILKPGTYRLVVSARDSVGATPVEKTLLVKLTS